MAPTTPPGETRLVQVQGGRNPRVEVHNDSDDWNLAGDQEAALPKATTKDKQRDTQHGSLDDQLYNDGRTAVERQDRGHQARNDDSTGVDIDFMQYDLDDDEACMLFSLGDAQVQLTASTRRIELGGGVMTTSNPFQPADRSSADTSRNMLTTASYGHLKQMSREPGGDEHVGPDATPGTGMITSNNKSVATAQQSV